MFLRAGQDRRELSTGGETSLIWVKGRWGVGGGRSKIRGILRLGFGCDSAGMTNFYPGYILLDIGHKKVA